MLQQIIHYSLHFLVIGIIAYLYDKEKWKTYWLILMATMLIDLDHLFADPIFDPERCSIGFHFLHSEIAIFIYLLGMIFVKNRIIKLIFIGLFFHMLTDVLDCIYTFISCHPCFLDRF